MARHMQKIVRPTIGIAQQVISQAEGGGVNLHTEAAKVCTEADTSPAIDKADNREHVLCSALCNIVHK